MFYITVFTVTAILESLQYHSIHSSTGYRMKQLNKNKRTQTIYTILYCNKTFHVTKFISFLLNHPEKGLNKKEEERKEKKQNDEEGGGERGEAGVRDGV